MQIHTLIENTTARPDLTAEHGLSLYIETGSHRILFDTGKSAAFADNAEKMGIDLSEADLCILSHGHYDHGGGIARFLEINSHAPVYLRQTAFDPHFSSGKYIGLDPALEGEPRLQVLSGDSTLAPGIRLCSMPLHHNPYPFGTFGQTVLREGISRQEDYTHEQYLLIEEAGRSICISGCSHRGVLNILSCFRPDVFIGGFHFIRMDPQGPELQAAARQLLTYPTRYYTGHCTGQEQYTVLKSILGPRLSCLSTGNTLTL